jgi:MFS transporter, ACS family, hexuronate transporter
LGLAEGGNFPAAVKAVGERFAASQQAMAIALLNSGSNMGVLAALIAVPLLTACCGWQYAFVVTGASGFCWVALWLWATRGTVRRDDLDSVQPAVIHRNSSVVQDWLLLLRQRQIWAYIVGMALCSPVWWFYLFWSSSILEDRFDIDLASLGWPMAAIYIVADLGSILGGWFAGFLMRRGFRTATARKIAMLIAACGTLPIGVAARTDELWLAVVVMGLAGAANQAFAANLFSIVTDTTPSHLVSSAVGLGGMFAGFAGAYSQQWVGTFLESSPGNYGAILSVVPAAYFVSLAAIQALAPHLAPISLPGSSLENDET